MFNCIFNIFFQYRMRFPFLHLFQYRNLPENRMDSLFLQRPYHFFRMRPFSMFIKTVKSRFIAPGLYHKHTPRKFQLFRPFHLLQNFLFRMPAVRGHPDSKAPPGNPADCSGSSDIFLKHFADSSCQQNAFGKFSLVIFSQSYSDFFFKHIIDHSSRICKEPKACICHKKLHRTITDFSLMAELFYDFSVYPFSFLINSVKPLTQTINGTVSFFQLQNRFFPFLKTSAKACLSQNILYRFFPFKIQFPTHVKSSL